jgi:hypothetical protein
LALAFWGLAAHKFYQRYHDDFVNAFEVGSFKAELAGPNGNYICK